MQIPSHIKAIIFDMYGVIVASEEAHYRAERDLLKNRGIKVSKQNLKNYAGFSSTDIFKDLKAKHRLQEEVRDLVKEKKKRFLVEIAKDIRPVPGSIMLITKFHHHKIPMAVGSSAETHLIKMLLTKIKVFHFFQAIVGSDEVIASKPAPDIFLLAAQKLKIKPENCCVIEDSAFGVIAAKAAHMFVIGFKNKASGKQDLSKADLIVDDLRKIDYFPPIGSAKGN